MTQPGRLPVLVFVISAWTGLLVSPASGGPEGQITIAVSASTAARWFDPAEAEGIITPCAYYYALPLKTAEGLGLTIPRSLLLRVDQVLE